jgi:hypothetical protein
MCFPSRKRSWLLLLSAQWVNLFWLCSIPCWPFWFNQRNWLYIWHHRLEMLTSWEKSVQLRKWDLKTQKITWRLKRNYYEVKHPTCWIHRIYQFQSILKILPSFFPRRTNYSGTRSSIYSYYEGADHEQAYE